MLEPLHLGLERCVRASAPILVRLADFVPRGTVRHLSKVKLGHTLRHVWRNAPVQRERWQAAGITASDLHSPDVLPHIPFTTGRDVAERPDDFVCVPREKLAHTLTTSGTTGHAKKIYLTDGDLARETRMIGTHLRRFRGASRAMVMVLVRGTSWSAGAVMQRSFRAGGFPVIVAGNELPVPEQVDLIRRHRINTIFAGSSYVHRFLFESDVDLRSLGVRYLHLGGQPFTEGFRAELESAWGAKVIDAYGLAEFAYGVAGECHLQDGLHITDVDYYVEIIDATSGSPVDDGVEGEVVITTLSRVGMPLVRYRTGDVASLYPEGRRCPCGLPLRRMSRVRGRLDDVLFMGSANIYPDEIDRAVLAVPGVSDYQLVVEKDDYKDVLNLTVETDDDAEHLRERLVDALKTVDYIRILHDIGKVLTFGRMSAVDRGTLSRGRPKSVRIIDRREEVPARAH